VIFLLSVALFASLSIQFYQRPECPEPNCPQPEVNLNCPTPACPEPDVTTNCPTCPERSVLKKIITNMKQEHDYELNVYDCTEFSRELSGRLNDKGFDARSEMVRVNCSSPEWSHWQDCEENGGKHQIVVVDNVYIESTSGKIIDPQKYDDYGI